MNKNLKIVFFGTPRFSVKILESLDEAGLTPSLVITAPDKPKGRKMVLTPPPVKLWAQKYKIKILQPKDKEELRIMNNELRNYDLFIVASYGKILPKSILEIPKHGTINVHPSLLPKYRGASPIQSVILNGEKETGTTIMLMNEKMDEGDILLKGAISIKKDDDAVSLRDNLSKKGIELLLNSIELIKTKNVNFVKQDNKNATYAPKLKKEDGLIDWSQDAVLICNRIRAFVPWPVCFTHFNKKILKIWKAYPEKTSSDLKPGTISEASKEGLLVATGKGAIRINELQLEAKRRMNIEEFIAGHKDIIGSVL